MSKPDHDPTRRLSWDRMKPSQKKKLRQQVLERDGGRCLTCGATTDLTIDHIVSLARGGSDEIDNLQTLCRSCNSRKNAGEGKRGKYKCGWQFRFGH